MLLSYRSAVHHTCQLPDVERERCIPVSLKNTQFVGDGLSGQALRELIILESEVRASRYVCVTYVHAR